MFSLKVFVIQRSVFQLAIRLSSSYTFPNEDLLYTIKSSHNHIRSALYPLNAADYPKRVLPDLHFMKIFRDIELLKENCEQRELMVDVHQLASDYKRWLKDKKEYKRLRDLHYAQEKLREQKEIDDLTMTDINEEPTTKTKKRKKKIQSSDIQKKIQTRSTTENQ